MINLKKVILNEKKNEVFISGVRNREITMVNLKKVNLNEKKNEAFISGVRNKIMPQEIIEEKIKGENFNGKIKKISLLILEGKIQFGNLSRNMIKFQYAFLNTMKEINLKYISEYQKANESRKNSILKNFSDTFLKYYYEKNQNKKFAVVNNNTENLKIAFKLVGKYLPSEKLFSSYDYQPYNFGWDYKNIAFDYKKAIVIKNILGDNLYHLEQIL